MRSRLFGHLTLSFAGLVLGLGLVTSSLLACGGGKATTDPTSPADPQPADPVQPTPQSTEPTGDPGPTKPEEPAKPAEHILVQVDASGIGLGGHDPVAYAQDNRPVAGVSAITSSHGGATYRLASADSKQKFDADPARYAPRYGGYCAYAASQNRLSQSDPKVFLIHDGALLMFTNRDFLARFQRDPAGIRRKADENWPALLEKHGKAP